MNWFKSSPERPSICLNRWIPFGAAGFAGTFNELKCDFHLNIKMTYFYLHITSVFAEEPQGLGKWCQPTHVKNVYKRKKNRISNFKF